MRASFEPNVLEIAFLVGWTAYGAVRDRFERLRARFPGGAVSDSSDADALVHEAPPARVAHTANDVTAEHAPRVAAALSPSSSPSPSPSPSPSCGGGGGGRRPRVDYSIN
jgi:hypothetical protein